MTKVREPPLLLDATDTVPIGDADAVAAATDCMLEACFGAGSFDRTSLGACFAVVKDLFAGSYPGYLGCDMPYHDLRHSLDTALVMARLVAGYQVERGSASSLTPEHGALGVMLGLLHDTGYIRKATEAALCGPQLTSAHESRSVEFASSFLKTTSLTRFAPLAQLIQATRLKTDLDQLFAGQEAPAIALGQMLGSADLLSQLSDRAYLERCYYHLYPELVLGGCDRTRGPDGQVQLLYHDAFDLLRTTPAFYQHVVCKRLSQGLGQMSRYLTAYFAGTDPYPVAIQRNLDRFRAILGQGQPTAIGAEPGTTTPELAAVYRALAPRPSSAH